MEKDVNYFDGLVNSKGEIFYTYEPETATVHHIGNGIACIETDSAYTLVKSNGMETAAFTSDDFDEIYGYGDGLMLVYKNIGTLMKEEHSYGVIGETGWVTPLDEKKRLANEAQLENLLAVQKELLPIPRVKNAKQPKEKIFRINKT